MINVGVEMNEIQDVMVTIDKTKVKLDILGIPFAKQSFRFTRSGIKYQPKEIVNAEYNVRAQAISQLPSGFKIFSQEVQIISIQFRFPPLKSFTKKQKSDVENGIIIPKLTKPDLTDNLMKGVIDALKGVVFTDDSIIWKVGEISKIYAQTPGVFIHLQGE